MTTNDICWGSVYSFHNLTKNPSPIIKASMTLCYSLVLGPRAGEASRHGHRGIVGIVDGLRPILVTVLGIRALGPSVSGCKGCRGPGLGGGGGVGLRLCPTHVGSRIRDNKVWGGAQVQLHFMMPYFGEFPKIRST